MDLEQLGLSLVVLVAVGFLGWYFVGMVVNRRRLADAARWVYHGLDLYRDPAPDRTKTSIKWLSTNAFNILVEGARPPLSGVIATVLLKSRDMVTVWLADQLSGRRDLLLLRYEFERQPIWGVEIFRRRSILAGDVRQLAAQEGWAIEASGDADLLSAHGGGRAGDLARELLAALGAERRALVRLSVRRQTPHLSLAIDLPNPRSADPAETMRLGERLAAITLDYCTR